MKDRLAELGAGLATRWLSVRRRTRVLDARHGHALRPRLAAAGVLALASALVLGVDTLAAARAGNGARVGELPSAESPESDGQVAVLDNGVALVLPTSTTAPPVPTTAAPSPPPPATPAVAPMAAPRPGAIPVGKGMWIWVPGSTDGGDVQTIVARAVGAGLTHVYVRTGSSWQGFHGGPFLDVVLPAAHAAGVRVYGWDFPSFTDPAADVARAMQAVAYTTPDGHRIDGFVPDIETASEGTHLEHAVGYAQALRSAVGDGYPLIATVPRPSSVTLTFYPYAELLPSFDAVAPMTYWLNRQPDSDVAGALQYLAQFGKPIIPVGQAFDGGLEGGRPGSPTPEEIRRFITAAAQYGAVGVSFWSWQHTTQELWDTIATAVEFTVPAGPVASFTTEQIRTVQRLLVTLGYTVEATGAWDQATAVALMLFQSDRGTAPTGLIDDLTRLLLLGPVPRS